MTYNFLSSIIHYYLKFNIKKNVSEPHKLKKTIYILLLSLVFPKELCDLCLESDVELAYNVHFLFGDEILQMVYVGIG